MNKKDLQDKWQKFVNDANKYGIPIPVLRDPKTGKGSVSLTLTFISFNMVLVGLAGKASGWFGGIDITQALYLFGTCAALYWGTKTPEAPADKSPSPQHSDKSPASVSPDDPDAQK